MSVARNLRRLLRKKDLPSRNNRVFLESMEPRLLLSDVTAHWIGGSGNWSDPTHWDIGYAPNNGGGNTYKVIIDDVSNPIVTIDQSVAISGLTSTDTVKVDSGGSLTTSGTVSNSGDLIAAGGSLTLSGATVTNTGHTITADGGTIYLTNSTITGGTVQSTLAGGSVTVGGQSTLDAV
ncbi:MAG TPA: hypothetical protein DCZ04_10800, partial [Syntrophorhabdus aromaticivorans]|nr:hypothetical protein [Syntrophorhabdus aromaticivorans]